MLAVPSCSPAASPSEREGSVTYCPSSSSSSSSARVPDGEGLRADLDEKENVGRVVGERDVELEEEKDGALGREGSSVRARVGTNRPWRCSRLMASALASLNLRAGEGGRTKTKRTRSATGKEKGTAEKQERGHTLGSSVLQFKIRIASRVKLRRVRPVHARVRADVFSTPSLADPAARPEVRAHAGGYDLPSGPVGRLGRLVRSGLLADTVLDA